MERKEQIKSLIRTIPGFPKPGIMFRDITTLMKSPEGLKLTIDEFIEAYKDKDFDVIVSLEARGFILGGAIAVALGKGFVPVRKPGKLPGQTISHSYELEYGTDTVEIHKDAIDAGQKVLIIDDLLATGGTAMAAAALVGQIGAKVVGMGFIVDLPDIGGSKKLKDAGYEVFNICAFEGD